MASGSAWWTRTTKARRPVTRRASHIHGWLVAYPDVGDYRPKNGCLAGACENKEAKPVVGVALAGQFRQ